MGKWIYKWLPILFGCHCRSDRSFFWKGKQFPLCDRCTGELIGILAAAVTYLFFHCSWIVSLFFMLPLIIDGFVQQLTNYESNNFRRFLTGCLFGVGFATFVMISVSFTVKWGYGLGRQWRNLFVFSN